MRTFYMLPVMVVLCACTSTDSDQPLAKFRNAVYHVGDQPAQASTRPSEARPAGGVQAPSKPTPQTDRPFF